MLVDYWLLGIVRPPGSAGNEPGTGISIGGKPPGAGVVSAIRGKPLGIQQSGQPLAVCSLFPCVYFIICCF